MVSLGRWGKMTRGPGVFETIKEKSGVSKYRRDGGRIGAEFPV
jgi:hypothetical protein